jgi:hypothetical protein
MVLNLYTSPKIRLTLTYQEEQDGEIRDMRNAYKILVKNLKGQDYLGDLHIYSYISSIAGDLKETRIESVDCIHLTLVNTVTNLRLPQKAGNLKSYTFWDIKPCSPLKVNGRLGGTCRYHLHGRSISQARNHHEAGSKQPTWRYTPEARTLHSHRCVYLKSYTAGNFFTI